VIAENSIRVTSYSCAHVKGRFLGSGGPRVRDQTVEELDRLAPSALDRSYSDER
jgi:hypothetical protein